MILALFDLDNTLLDGDSDCLWTEFLADEGILGEEYRKRSDEFYAEYVKGEMDIQAFLEFQLEPLSWFPMSRLEELRKRFVDSKILHRIPRESRQLLDSHRKQGHSLAIVTATNRFVTEPIARLLGVSDLIATEPELLAGAYTGRPCGVPCYQQGKVTCVMQWLVEIGVAPTETWFYSDSFNDVPLLSWVDRPIVVNPDPRLEAHAREAGWGLIRIPAETRENGGDATPNTQAT